MEAISELRERILTIYSRAEMYITPVVRFLLALVSLLMINSGLGFMDKLTKFVIVFVVALISAFLPLSFTIVVDALFIMLHLYELSLQVAVVVALVFLLMFVLYFRFTPKEAIAVVITPMLFAMKIPYVAALMVGFIGSPVSFISVCCGTVVYFIVSKIGGDPDAFTGDKLSIDSALSAFKSVIDNVLNNKTMILMVIVCALIVVLTNVIRRLSFDYSWIVALAVSSISGLIVIVIGSSVLDAEVGIVGAIVSMLISVIIVAIIQLFIYNLDYSRAEYVQFQDEEYYYYVKAIPRYDVSTGRRR